MSDRLSAFQTPPTLTGAIAMRMVIAPVEFMAYVGEVLSYLSNPDNWDLFGSVTVEEAANEGIKMLDFFYDYSLVGMVSFFAGVLPDGWIALDGSTISQSDFEDLAAVVPADWLSGSDIVLPDTTGRFLAGSGAGFDLGGLGGESEHTLTVAEMPAHTHTYQPPAINPDVEGPGIPDVGATILGPLSNTGSAGSGEPHNNMPPYLVLTAAIFAGVSNA